LIAIGFLQLMKILRRKWLWRQSGMVKSARWVVPRKVSFISVIIFVAGLVLGIVYQKVTGEETLFLMRLLYAMAGVSFAYAQIAMGKILQLNRYILIGVVGGALSVLSLGLPLTPGVYCLVLFSCWFLLLMISGVLTMLKSVQNMKSDTHAG